MPEPDTVCSTAFPPPRPGGASTDPMHAFTANPKTSNSTPPSPVPHRSARFHHSSLQARSYLDPVTIPSPIVGRVSSHLRQTVANDEPENDDGGNGEAARRGVPRVQPSFEPLWEDSDTFEKVRRREFEEMGKRVGKLVSGLKERLGSGGGESRRGEFRVSVLLSFFVLTWWTSKRGVVGPRGNWYSQSQATVLAPWAETVSHRRIIFGVECLGVG